MVRFIINDMNNRPLSFASVRLISEDGARPLLYDKESASFLVRRFRPGMYELEVNADNFESGKKEIYIPKAGIERTIVLAK